MAVQDRVRWDERYARSGPVTVGALEPPGILALHADAFPTTGHALDLACGQGFGAVWLAHRGLDVRAFDISPVAINQARELARRSGVVDRCRFDVFDLDDGLPVGLLSDGPRLSSRSRAHRPGPLSDGPRLSSRSRAHRPGPLSDGPRLSSRTRAHRPGPLSDWPDADVILCHKFRDRRLDQAIIERLAPGGLLAIAALSAVDAAPGPYRVGPGELSAAFAELELVAAGEGQGYAWLLARA
jgi:SAM-dependent methyltransferase